VEAASTLLDHSPALAIQAVREFARSRGAMNTSHSGDGRMLSAPAASVGTDIRAEVIAFYQAVLRDADYVARERVYAAYQLAHLDRRYWPEATGDGANGY